MLIGRPQPISRALSAPRKTPEKVSLPVRDCADRPHCRRGDLLDQESIEVHLSYRLSRGCLHGVIQREHGDEEKAPILPVL